MSSVDDLAKQAKHFRLLAAAFDDKTMKRDFLNLAERCEALAEQMRLKLGVAPHRKVRRPSRLRSPKVM